MNPYQQNIDIVKDFFKRKLILFYVFFTILPIFSILFININDLLRVAESLIGGSVLSEIVYNTNLVGTISSLYTLFIFDILLAVVFLLFYVKAGSNESSLKAPTGMFRVVSVIQIIVTALASLAMVFVVLFLSLHILATCSVMTSILTVPFIIAAIPILLLLEIAQVLFAETIKNSVNSIYLKKTGVKLFGVMNLIVAAICVYVGALIAVYCLPENLSLIPTIVFFGLCAAKYSVGAAVGLKYTKYIKSFSDSFAVREDEPKDDNPNIIVCKKCGKPLTPDDYFCNHCGTPVDK